MKDLKKIQEFFSKPLEEGKQLDQVDFAKVVKAVEQTGHPVTVLLVPKFNEIEVLTGMDAPDDMLRDLSNAVDSLGYGRNDIIIAGDSSNLSRREYSDIRRVNGGAKDYFEESETINEVKEMTFGAYLDDLDNRFVDLMKAAKGLNAEGSQEIDMRATINQNFTLFRNYISALKKEYSNELNKELTFSINEDLNDPVLMKMRADKFAGSDPKAGSTIKGTGFNWDKNTARITFLQKERERLMRDMEQEAEPEGGPIADEYGDKLNRIDAAIAKLSGRKEMTYDQAIAEGKGKMPTQDQVDKFFALTQNETHYLNSKPVEGQEKTFNLMKVEPWDEYDLSNWNSLVRKAKQRGKSMDENDKASIIKDKIEKLRKLSNSGEIDGDEFLDKFNPLQKQLKSIDEASRARVSMPRFVKDKNSPNFLNVYIDYDLGPGGNSVAFGKETMSGQIRRESAAEAMRLAGDVARDLEAEYDLEDIDIQDLKNGKVRIFAVSDDFIDMNPNMLGEASKGAMNYFSDLKYNYQKAFRYLDVEEREEYKQLVKDFFSKLQVDDKIRAVGLDEATEEEENEFHKDLDKLVHKTFGHSSDEKKKPMAQELAETIKLGEGVIEEELCPKGKAYIKKRKAAGEKSSAYLSGRAVKVCKGQMSGRKKKK